MTDAIVKRLSMRAIAFGCALAAVPLGAAGFMSGMISNDICTAYKVGSVGTTGDGLLSSCAPTIGTSDFGSGRVTAPPRTAS